MEASGSTAKSLVRNTDFQLILCCRSCVFRDGLVECGSNIFLLGIRTVFSLLSDRLDNETLFKHAIGT